MCALFCTAFSWLAFFLLLSACVFSNAFLACSQWGFSLVAGLDGSYCCDLWKKYDWMITIIKYAYSFSRKKFWVLLKNIIGWGLYDFFMDRWYIQYSHPLYTRWIPFNMAASQYSILSNLFSSDRDSKLFNQDIIIKSKTLPSGCLHSLIRLRLLPRGRHFFLSQMIQRTRSDNDVIDTLISDWSKTKTGKTSKRCGGLGKHRIVWYWI